MGGGEGGCAAGRRCLRIKRGSLWQVVAQGGLGLGTRDCITRVPHLPPPLSPSLGGPCILRRDESMQSVRSGRPSSQGQPPGLSEATSYAQLPTYPICLICLDMLTPEDFAKGDAILLDCLCKGEVAMRHRSCAIEWSNVGAAA